MRNMPYAFPKSTLPRMSAATELRQPIQSAPAASPLTIHEFASALGSFRSTGTSDMIALSRAVGLKQPEFRQDGGSFVQTLWRPVAPHVAAPVTAPVGEFVEKLLRLLAERSPLGDEAIREAFALKSRRRLRETYINPAPHRAHHS